MKRFGLILMLAAGCGGSTPAAEPVEKWMDFERITVPEATQPLVSGAAIPGTSNEILALGIGGYVQHLRIEDRVATELGSFTIDLEPGCSLLSVAFDPDWATNRFLFVGQCTTVTGSEIVRYRFEPPNYDQVAATGVRIHIVDEPAATEAWHQVGSIGFFADGSMWALFGEQLRSSNAQDTTNDLGKILRIIPSRDPAMGGYTPHPQNPFFMDTNGNSQNIYAWGVRSPFRGTLDSNDRLWVADVGEDKFEEVNQIASAGANLGWPEYEGRCRGLNCNTLQPVVWWAHSDEHPYVLEDDETVLTTNRNAYAGIQYRPTNDRYEGRLTNRIIYGDMCTGWVRSVSVNSSPDMPVEDRLDGHRPYISQWIQTGDDTLYVTTLGLCEDPTKIIEEPGLWRMVVSDDAM